jgi:hypothetical protein
MTTLARRPAWTLVISDTARNTFVVLLMVAVGYAVASASTPARPPRWPPSPCPWPSATSCRGSRPCSA